MTRIYLRYSTYGELFKVSLEERIESGGDVGTMVTLVNTYQGSDPIAARFAFRDWVQETSFSCERCDRAFSPDSQVVVEDDFILCSRCIHERG